MKKTLLFLLSLILCTPMQVSAENLSQVFEDAFANDPIFKAARADWLAREQTLPIARGALLPQLTYTGDYYSFRQNINSPVTRQIAESQGFPYNGVIKDTGHQDILSVTQTLFNYSQWAALKNARAVVKQAVASFDAAFQDLIIRTASAYFDVLNASDNVRYSKEHEKELANKLSQYKERYKVGLIAITDVYDTQAEYERSVAERIEAQNTLENNLESLRVITGKIYSSLQGPGDSLPLKTPSPMNIERWVEVSQKQNYSYLAAFYEAQAAREKIGVEYGHGLPTANIQGSYTYERDSNLGLAAASSGPSKTGAGSGSGIGRTTAKTPRVDLNLSYPIYQGGTVLASTRQANYTYQRLDAERERVLRNVIANTRKSYLGIISSMSQVKAYKQSVKSSLSALQSSEAGYLVGTKTILDVLTAQSALYQNQKSFSERQYDYLTFILDLKKAAGTLSVRDIDQMNSWLDRKASFHDSYLVKSTMEQGEANPTSIPTIPRPKPKKKVHHKEHKKPEQEKAQVKRGTYAIQLFSAKSEKEAEDFIQKYNLKNKAFSLYTKYNERWRYRVFYGQYASSKEAEEGLKHLPENLKYLKPLVRKL